jgi:1-acyl-sn-glycerol-3-phosphate acyltransferase
LAGLSARGDLALVVASGARETSLNDTSLFRRVLRTARSFLFFGVYAVFLVFFFGLGQRVIIWPLTVLWPARRNDIVGWWFRLLANATIGLARVFGDVHVERSGSLVPGSSVVLMNHQSLLDIPIAYSMVCRPHPVIPTRKLYARGIPGVSPLLRLARAPFVTQTRASARQDLKAIAAAAEEVAAGRLSLLIFPEGHRTHDGQISPFMTAGLKVILARARRPVYLIVVDGLWHARTTGEALFTFAGSRAKVKVVGPIEPPEKDQIDAFIAEMERLMVSTLAEMRA